MFMDGSGGLAYGNDNTLVLSLKLLYMSGPVSTWMGIRGYNMLV